MTRAMLRAWGWGVLLILTIALAAPNMARADISEDAKVFIGQLSDEVLTQLTDANLSLKEQEERFRVIVKKYVAYNTIARWVLGGRSWKKASEAQREKYLSLYGDLMVTTYAHRFQGYSGESLKITKARIIDANQVLVESQIARAGADKPLVVNWRVRGADGKYRIIDIMVEGLSMAQTQRSEFKSFLRTNGGDMNALLTDLEVRLEKARSDRVMAQKGTSQ